MIQALFLDWLVIEKYPKLRATRESVWKPSKLCDKHLSKVIYVMH